MIAALAAALSLAGPPAIDVPFVPQSDALCGGAAVAMVFRYWGDAHADVAQFAPLVERRPGGVVGIANDVLVSAVQARGWRVESGGNSLPALRSQLDARRPVIVLLADRRDRYHYVVVTGASDETVVVHDPSWGPRRRIDVGRFSRLWAAASRWSIVVLPSPDRVKHATADATTSPAERVSRTTADAAPPRDEVATPASPASTTANATTAVAGDPCDALLNQAIDDVRAQGLDRADEILARVRRRCPASAGPYRELAGVRFAQRKWRDASDLAREAIRRQRDDAFALDVLGASLFMQDDAVGALRAWNQIGKPRLDLVRIDGLHRARYQTIDDALGLTPGSLLTADAFARASRRLADLPDRTSARIGVRPGEDGFASVDVAIVERGGWPRGWTDWSGAAVHAAVDREAAIAVPGFTGQGETWFASWRWWRNRPRIAAGFATPRLGSLPGVWRVDGSWEVEAHRSIADGDARESRTHGGLSVSDWLSGNVRYSVGIGLDAWSAERAGVSSRAASIGASLERRWLGDRVAVGGTIATWMPVGVGPRFTVAGFRSTARSSSSPAAHPWLLQLTAGAERASDRAPMSLWPGAGDGRAREPLLRAHPLLDHGVIDVGAETAFGRSLQYGNVDVVRWLARPQLVRIGIGGFVDVARSARSALDEGRTPYVGGSPDVRHTTHVDAGGGLRIRVPGMTSILRVDVAHGLRDGANAVSVGWWF